MKKPLLIALVGVSSLLVYQFIETQRLSRRLALLEEEYRLAREVHAQAMTKEAEKTRRDVAQIQRQVTVLSMNAKENSKNGQQHSNDRAPSTSLAEGNNSSNEKGNSSPSTTFAGRKTTQEHTNWLESLERDFLYYDSNQNQKVSPKEANLSPEEMEVYDWNGNGEVDKWEIDKLKREIGRANRHAQKNDTGDGAFPITRDEYKGWDRRFNRADKNRDGVMDADEYLNFRHDIWLERTRYDVNRDGKISGDEFGGGKKRFTSLDENKDGHINTNEVESAILRGQW